MTVPAAEEPSGYIPEFEYGLAMESISLLDCSRQAYFDACANYAAHPVNKNFNAIELTAELHSDAFQTALTSVMEDTPLPEFTRVLCHLLSQQDATRVDYLNAVLGKDSLVKMDNNFEYPTDDEWEIAQQDTYKVAYLKSFREFFDSGISKDTEKFLEEVAATKPARKMELYTALRHHALDVGKIALGTALGIWAVRRKEN